MITASIVTAGLKKVFAILYWNVFLGYRDIFDTIRKEAYVLELAEERNFASVHICSNTVDPY